jgi:predicted phosphodiesterase
MKLRNFLHTLSAAFCASAFYATAPAFTPPAAAAPATDAAAAGLSQRFSVLQLNLRDFAAVAKSSDVAASAAALEPLVGRIADAAPDVLLLCELGADGALGRRLAGALAKRGLRYHADGLGAQTGILSKHPLRNTNLLLAPPTFNKKTPTRARLIALHRTVTKAEISVGARTVVLYSAHLDDAHFAPLLPRGFDIAGKKLATPLTDAVKILAVNRAAVRDDALKHIFPDIQNERSRGRLIIFGGDFNEPSHLDWQADTASLFGHNGTVVNWDVSLMLNSVGLVDSFRQRHPNAATAPGFTTLVNTDKNTEAADAIRERTDFIYHAPQTGIELIAAEIFEHSTAAKKGNLASYKITGTDTPRTPATQKSKFAFLTDIHLRPRNIQRALDGYKKALAFSKQNGVQFIILGGDLVDASGGGVPIRSRKAAEELYKEFKDATDAIKLPVHATIGNHDVYRNKGEGCPVGDELFIKFLGVNGKSYHAFEQDGVKFFILNSVLNGYSIGREQIAWLKSELAKTPLSTPCIISTHVPIYTIWYPAIMGRVSSSDMIKNFREVLETFREHNLKLVFQGHMHVYEEIQSKGVTFITGGAVSGSWWGGPYHGTEEGVLLITTDTENNFAWKYEDYGW